MKNILSATFVCILSVAVYSQDKDPKTYFDSIDNILYVSLKEGCTFNSGWSLTFNKDYKIRIGQNKDELYFVAVNPLFWGEELLIYEIFIKKFQCSSNSLVVDEYFKINADKPFAYDLESNLLTIDNGTEKNIWDINHVNPQEIKAFYKQD